MRSSNNIKHKLIFMVILIFAIALTASQAGAGEKVRLEGTIQGAKCTHFKVKCYNDDNHIALEPDFVFVMPSGEYYFMPNLPRDVKSRHAYEKVRVHGELQNQELWVDKLVGLDASGARSKTTWDWTDRLDLWEPQQ